MPKSQQFPNSLTNAHARRILRLQIALHWIVALPIPTKLPHCPGMIAPPDSEMISAPWDRSIASGYCCHFVRG